MGHISTIFVEKLAELAKPETDDVETRDALSRFVDVDPALPTDPGRMISDTTFFQLLEHIAAEYEDGRSIAVRLGATMRCDDYGAFGLAFKSAVDLWGSFQRVERYGKVVTSIANFTVEEGGRSSFMAVRPDKETRLGLRMTNELAVSAATALSREVCPGDFSPVTVKFSHAAPEDLSAQESHFRCPVHFGADADGLEISDASLRAGNRLGDAQISDFFDNHLDQELEQFVDGTRLAQQVRGHIFKALSEGAPRVADVALNMGMSSRTLQRRLAAEGCVYQDLVDSARRDLAEQLLRQTDFALAEVAFLTGYAEQSTFARAFKRWHGQTPASFRRSAVNY
jgi:AraC-like DNA-binding protein